MDGTTDGAAGGRARGLRPRARSCAAGLLALLGLGFAVIAQANTCAPAATQGAAPADYQNYCWLDFSGYSDAQAQGGGQTFTFVLPDTSTLSMTVQVTTNGINPALDAHAVPTWSGAAIGHNGFNGIPGLPVLYEVQSGSTVTVVLNNITVTPPAGGGAIDSYAIIAADGESTNSGESLQFTTNGSPWAQVAQIPNGGNYPTVAGVTTNTVTETGVTNGNEGSFAFASFTNPTVVSAKMVGSGLQGIMFAVRYASMSVTAQFGNARANAADQFTYSIKSLGGATLATGTTTGAGSGPFPPASLATIAAGYPFVVSEVQAPGSVSPIADYALSLTCTNQTGGSLTALPVNLAASTYTFPSLQYGDAISCVFTDTANRTNLTIAKSGPANVNAGAAVAYNLAVANTGPLGAAGALVQDPAVANFTATGVACSGASGGAVCPAAAQLTVGNLQGAGIAIPALPSGGSVTLVVSGTAGTANITNTAAISPPPGVVNGNPTPTSTATTTVTASADVAVTLGFPASVNAGQTVAGTVLYTNNGPSTASATTFSLSVAPNLATPPSVTGLPAGATFAYIPATGVITLSGMPATLASGASVGPIGVSYTQPGSATSTVSAAIGTTTNDPNPANNSATAAIGGAAVADLAAAVSFPASVNAGQTVAGTVLYTNNGPSTASGTAYTLNVAANLATAPTVTGLPAGATFAYIPATGVITLSGMPATLASGASVGPIGVSYTQPATAASTVTASVGSATMDPNPANNSATAAIGGALVADLAAALSFPATVNAGQTVAGTVLYTNNGPSTASGTAYTLNVAANLATAPTVTGLPAGATSAYVPATGAIVLSGMPATLSAGANVGPIGVSYTQPASGTSAVTAAISSATTDPNPANNSASAAIGGSMVADAAVKLDLSRHRQRRPAGRGYGAVLQQWTEQRERHHVHLERCTQSRDAADRDRPAGGRKLRLRSRHRRRHVERHAGNSCRRREHRPDRRRLYPAAIRDFGGERDDRHHHHRFESRQQQRRRHRRRIDGGRSFDHPRLPGDGERGTTGGRHRAVRERRTQHRERRHLHVERRGQSRDAADPHRTARGRELQLRSRHRCDRVERHAGDPRLRRERRSDRHCLHPAALRNIQRNRGDQLRDHRS